jgi:WD40-like Beta Propeller Repeat
VWGDETFVDYDLGINSCIRQVRAALGDDSERPHYVETVPRVGYRFTVPLGTDATAPRSSRATARPKPTRFASTVGIIGVAAFIVGAYWFAFPKRSREERSGLVRTRFTRITSEAGAEIYPSLSPDGGFVVYESRASGVSDLYRQRIGGETRFNLTADSGADDTEPAFSPDGDRIAFRSEREGGGIFVMGATGESVRRITDAGFNPAWSPDGRRIVISPLRFFNATHGPVGEDRALRIVDVGSGREITVAEGRFSATELVSTGATDRFLDD